MKFDGFVTTMESVVDTNSTNQKQEYFEEAIEHCYDSEQMVTLSRLVLGTHYDDPEKNTEVGWRTVLSVAADSTPYTEEEIKLKKNELGKTSLAVGWAFEEMFKENEPIPNPKPELYEIENYIQQLPDANGDKARARIIRDILDLAWSGKEAKWLSYCILTDLSIGASWKTFAQAWVSEEGLNKSEVYKAVRLLGNLSRVIAEYEEKGRLPTQPRLMEPFRPMLASSGKSASEYTQDRWIAQKKYDGARLLIHNTEGETKLYSRNMKDVTDSLPEIVEPFEHDDRDMILDAEAVAYEDGEPLPFNKVMERFRREKNVGKMREQIPVRAHIFDCLIMYDEYLGDVQFDERLECIPDDITAHESLQIAETTSDAEEMYEMALDEGHEGIIAKDRDAEYEFSRSSAWQKIKPTETVDLEVKRTVKGTGQNAGKLGAVVVQTSDGTVLGNVGGGFTDKEREEWKNGELEGEVIEVMAEEVSETDKGEALRFPRFIEVRDDKDQADSLERVKDVIPS